MEDFVIEMLNITKDFPGIRANDDITLQLKRGEIHALLGENGAGKSTLMSVLFGLYQPESGTIKKDGQIVHIKNPNDANALNIGMVHQHFKLVEVFTVLENIILGVEPNKMGFLQKKEARLKVVELSERYGLKIDPDALIEDISVGMQQRVEILKMLYRNNDILIFDEPTAVLTPQEIDELMQIMRSFAAEGKSILFITHKLNEIMAVADRCTVLRKGKCIGTVDVASTDKVKLSRMMVGRDVEFIISKSEATPGNTILEVNHLTVPSKLHKNNAVKDVSFHVRAGEIVCLAGIEGNGQTEFVYALTGLEHPSAGEISLKGTTIVRIAPKRLKQNKASLASAKTTLLPIRSRSKLGMSHIPEDRQKFGLILDYSLEQNLVLQRYWEPAFQKNGFIKNSSIRQYAEKLIQQYDIRSVQGAVTSARSMSGGNQQKAIVAREIDKDPDLLVAVQPTRGLDVGAIEYIHHQLIAERDKKKAILLISLELDEVMNVSDRILVMYEGEIVGEFDPRTTTVQEIGLYMAGAKRQTSGNGVERA
jgi:simple sugar transport system ATP-binding protein